MTAYASIDTAVEAVKRGATDYIPKPFTPAQIKLAVRKVFEMRTLEQKVASLREDLGRSFLEADFSSGNPAMRRAVSPPPPPGQGDGLPPMPRSCCGEKAARARGSWPGPSMAGAAVPTGLSVFCPAPPSPLNCWRVNCSATPRGPLHRRGPATIRARISACEGGTLFLDEIGDLPPALQPKLLRFVQDREYERLGDYVTRRADVRVIACDERRPGKGPQGGAFPGRPLLPAQRDPDRPPPLAGTAGGPDDPGRAPGHLLQPELPQRTWRVSPPRRSRPSGTTPGPETCASSATSSNEPSSSAGGRGSTYATCRRTCAPPTDRSGWGNPLPLGRIEEEHIRRVLADARSLQEAADILGIDQATLWRRRKQYNI